MARRMSGTSSSRSKQAGWAGTGGLLLYYMLGSDRALWPAGERREGEHITYDKGYYHSYKKGGKSEAPECDRDGI